MGLYVKISEGKPVASAAGGAAFPRSHWLAATTREETGAKRCLVIIFSSLLASLSLAHKRPAVIPRGEIYGFIRDDRARYVPDVEAATGRRRLRTARARAPISRARAREKWDGGKRSALLGHLPSRGAEREAKIKEARRPRAIFSRAKVFLWCASA